ncbi:MAG: 6-hydroxymethylpterin diphosphokinase MptE-like protein [Halanaeroarchaeum sp.]
MHYADWNTIYERIREDFGYDRAADERARDVLAEYATPFDFGRLDVGGNTVAIAGGASTLEAEIDVADDADCVFAASIAADELLGAGVGVDLMVTDLDKNPETAIALTRAGRPVAVHAHGDNVPLVHDVLPRMDVENVLGTTQVRPVGSVYDLGGFTDGDRAAFLADHLGAAQLVFPGWDFDDPDVDPIKRKKLQWAKRLLVFLERRRDERFDVLDGHRSDVEPL